MEYLIDFKLRYIPCAVIEADSEEEARKKFADLTQEELNEVAPKLSGWDMEIVSVRKRDDEGQGRRTVEAWGLQGGFGE